MHPLRRRKLLVLLLMLFVLSLVAGLVLYALGQNISLFYTPTQVVQGEAPKQHSVRVGGVVVAGSIRREHGLDVRFKLTDYVNTVSVVYKGILPDLFREKQGVVTQGLIDDDLQVNATQVLAKHDENYMPPEVKAALKPKAQALFGQNRSGSCEQVSGGRNVNCQQPLEKAPRFVGDHGFTQQVTS